MRYLRILFPAAQGYVGLATLVVALSILAPFHTKAQAQNERDREKARTVLLDIARTRPADVGRLNYVAEGLVLYDLAVSKRPWLQYITAPSGLMGPTLRRLLHIDDPKDKYFKNLLELAQGKVDSVNVIDTPFFSLTLPVAYKKFGLKVKGYEAGPLSPHWDDTVLNQLGRPENRAYIAQAAKKLLLQDIENIPDDNLAVKNLDAEKRRLDKLPPQDRKKELQARLNRNAAAAAKNGAEMREAIKSQAPNSPRLILQLMRERSEQQFAFGTLSQLFGHFGDRKTAAVAQGMVGLAEQVWALDAGVAVGAAAVPGGQYVAIGLAVVNLIQAVEELQKEDRDPVLEGINAILSELKSVKEQIADLGRHLDTKLDIYFGALFDRLTKIEVQLGGVQQNLLEISSELDLLSEQVTRGFREVREREFHALLLKCFDDDMIVRKPVVTDRDVTECVKTFATNIIHPQRQVLAKGLPVLKEDLYWPFSDNAETFRLWLLEFTKREKLQALEQSISQMGVIPSGVYWASNADALASLVGKNPWVSSDTLTKDVLKSGADIGRQIINIYDAFGPRRSRQANENIGEQVLVALLRASSSKQLNILAPIEKNPWSVATGRLDPRGDFDQKVSHKPEFAGAPLPTCDKIKGTEGFDVDVSPATWPSDIGGGNVPDKAAVADAFRSQRLALPDGADKKLSSWALNANVVRPLSLVACLSRVSVSNYSVLGDLKRFSRDHLFSFDFTVKIDVWLTWDGRETPVSEPKPMAALVSRQELHDRGGAHPGPCMVEFPRAEAFPELLWNGIWSWSVPNHSLTMRLCSQNGTVKGAWEKLATETVSDVRNKQARDEAKKWISAKLKEERDDASKVALINNKGGIDEIRQVRQAFSDLLQFAFWPELISDVEFRGIVERAAEGLDVDGNLIKMLEGSNSGDLEKRLEDIIAKLQKWMSEPTRDYNLPRQTLSIEQVVGRLERANGLFTATAQ